MGVGARGVDALAAEEILARHWRDHEYKIDSKGNNNPVTTADFEADDALKTSLRGEFPHYGWLSEEAADDGAGLKRERVWIVDPPAGTNERIKCVPDFVVAIALDHDGAPLLRVTHNAI